MEEGLNRFLIAQERDYSAAVTEIKSGLKRSHWMWYVFPQFAGLGRSETSIYFAIKDKVEAIDYLNHPILGNRLKEISNELLKLETCDARLIFGNMDASKLKSSMTLFSKIKSIDGSVFDKVLEKFFEGRNDHKTISLLTQEYQIVNHYTKGELI